VEGWRPEAGVRGEGRRWARDEEDYAMAEIEGDVGGQRGRRGRVHPSKARRTAGESREEKSSGRSPHGELTYRHFAMESLSFLSSPYTN
jgi:hypothetical protein